MKFFFESEKLNRILKLTQRVLLAGAILLLGYTGFVFFGARIFQNRENISLDEQRRNPDTVPSPKAVEQLVGRIEIPRLGVSVVIMEGIEEETLDRAAGHIPGTPLPGQIGNVGISAHRDTYFRPLRNIRRDDIITIATPRADFRYRVLTTRIVSPEDLTVLSAADSEILTLVTCYPFYFIGPAPSRFIVRAERIT